jgi:capsular exopolysaccharide synthesis family protein
MSRSMNKRPIITQVNPRSPISESYRALRTNIDYSSFDNQIQVIALTSAGPGEGKSTTASNLAVTYAQSEKKVLLIDADLRKPTMHNTFFISNRHGLSNLIAGQYTPEEIIKETHVENLFLLPSGPIPPNPSEMLASKRMEQTLNQLRDLYDFIIIDTPPTLAVTDSQIVASKCDGIILVIDYGKVKREMAMKAKANLEHVKARILGVVLNNIDRKNADSYYYYYYGSDSKKA